MRAPNNPLPEGEHPEFSAAALSPSLCTSVSRKAAGWSQACLLAVALALAMPAHAADRVDPQADKQAFQKFFTSKYPKEWTDHDKRHYNWN